MLQHVLSDAGKSEDLWFLYTSGDPIVMYRAAYLDEILQILRDSKEHSPVLGMVNLSTITRDCKRME